MYMTISAFFRGLGPVLGFILSSACLAFYEDPGCPPEYDSEDPRWIGAWWIGFIVLAGFQLVFTAPLLLFPKQIRKSPDATTTFHESGIFAAMFRLFRNPIYMFHLFSQIFKWFGILGYFNYLPKYVQEQFRVSASSAALYGGSLPIALSLLAALFGGVTIRYWKPDTRLLTLLMFLLEIATVVLILALGLFKCEAPDYTVGANEAMSRCVDPNDKTFSLAIYQGATALFGSSKKLDSFYADNEDGDGNIVENPKYTPKNGSIKLSGDHIEKLAKFNSS
ncbi:solute carrier organic anion transporter family member 1C1-like [Tropilaelaps mercedesae]|uniref:Solute carrier organic anion transporter family member 1C1-like n=1 Tax=Tropilaelaps mercedesae TaxID=418985 RepID=A0A1V9X4S4_9ACAR|nr:solute carrier organic anion transporter family member 1C1-like [Tropilaelaps mercedesae]